MIRIIEKQSGMELIRSMDELMKLLASKSIPANVRYVTNANNVFKGMKLTMKNCKVIPDARGVSGITLQSGQAELVLPLEGLKQIEISNGKEAYITLHNNALVYIGN